MITECHVISGGQCLKDILTSEKAIGAYSVLLPNHTVMTSLGSVLKPVWLLSDGWPSIIPACIHVSFCGNLHHLISQWNYSLLCVTLRSSRQESRSNKISLYDSTADYGKARLQYLLSFLLITHTISSETSVCCSSPLLMWVSVVIYLMWLTSETILLCWCGFLR